MSEYQIITLLTMYYHKSKNDGKTIVRSMWNAAI